MCFEEENGVLVVIGEIMIDDEVVFGFIDSGWK